ncbi:phosphonates import ATP-binding protein PhnC [Insulibacter thermoxylanivorax]|uniref:Phosphonates import ATP-binding protein PhnC n=1 Tax=Insulibacter thermoxylanivorax TaxID=2749268 RepID=A0A916QJ65_9BACL|nr:ATP-binding cassette domain-containing protein [Insulibacter thermoxylanivorax]GFR39492.1 phosphonates import ATP-binding protein PhnC [Insulibacter thermoxylanivorax]
MIIRNLRKSYDEQVVLKGVSLAAGQGEMVAILGPSGSGKSVLLKCIALRERWDGGEFIYDDDDLLKQGWLAQLRYRSICAYLPPKEISLNPNKTALKNVLSGLLPTWRKLIGARTKREYMTAMDYLENVGLLDLAHRKVQTLSGGEKQRVAVAKALIQGADIIVADEPVIGLDPESAQLVLKDLRYMCDKHKATVLFTIPQIEWAEKYATRLIGLVDGQVIFDVSGRRLTTAEKMKL